ncbi:hypothetical protein BDV23DRAFT_182382 [Aspergillus alliaceus]|uniref:Uncharacterized protein n=1 Tax=Petromyces alliaceus TaxID=209559 RepID=A0A5N7CCV8_PETAA|nr:hypothetical protein BDV23DRAFT_182382 [Aspergillus alliaceus]
MSDTFLFAAGPGPDFVIKYVRIRYISTPGCARHCVLTFFHDEGNASVSFEHSKDLSQSHTDNKVIWIENDSRVDQESTLFQAHYTCPSLKDTAYKIYAHTSMDSNLGCSGFVPDVISLRRMRWLGILNRHHERGAKMHHIGANN